MKKAQSGNGTVHLFTDVVVQRSAQRGPATALCGQYTHAGTFTGVQEEMDELDGVCSLCEKAVED